MPIPAGQYCPLWTVRQCGVTETAWVRRRLRSSPRGTAVCTSRTRRSVVLESRSCLDAGSQAFVGAVILGWVEVEAWHRVQRSQAIGVLGERALPVFGVELAGHVGDERGQHVEAAVPEQAVMDRPEDVEPRAVDAVRLVGVGGRAGGDGHHGEFAAQHAGVVFATG